MLRAWRARLRTTAVPCSAVALQAVAVTLRSNCLLCGQRVCSATAGAVPVPWRLVCWWSLLRFHMSKGASQGKHPRALRSNRASGKQHRGPAAGQTPPACDAATWAAGRRYAAALLLVSTMLSTALPGEGHASTRDWTGRSIQLQRAMTRRPPLQWRRVGRVWPRCVREGDTPPGSWTAPCTPAASNAAQENLRFGGRRSRRIRHGGALSGGRLRPG